MSQRFIKISTVNGEDRWINVDRVQRVSLARDLANAQPIMVLTFDDHDRVTLHGTDDVQRTLIRSLSRVFDELAHPVDQFVA